MVNEKSHNRKVKYLKIFGVLVAFGSTAAVVPPVVSKIHSGSLINFTGGGNINSSGTGNVINTGAGNINNTNNTNNTTYNYLWTDGIKILTGNQNPSTDGKLIKVASVANEKPEVGALGLLVNNVSLLNDATWTPEISRIPRFFEFRFKVEAIADSEKLGRVDVTLVREGKDVCMVSLNSRTSYSVGGVRKSDSSCVDVVPNNTSVIYRAKVVSSEMTPIVIELARVDARDYRQLTPGN